MKITAIKPNPRDAAQGFARLEDGVEAWSPDYKLLEELVGKEIPEGWVLKDNKAGTGKVLLPPKPKGGGRWRDTREGAEFDQAGYQRHQEYEQERMDRRTALMQARELLSGTPDGTPAEIVVWAEFFYDFLREPLKRGAVKEVPSSQPGGASATATQAAPRTSDELKAVPPLSPSPSDTAAGGKPVPPRRQCEHEVTKVVTQERGGQITVCANCGVVLETAAKEVTLDPKP